MNSVNSELSLFWDDFEFWIDSTTLGKVQFERLKNCKIYPNPLNDIVKIQTKKTSKKYMFLIYQGSLSKRLIQL